MSSNTFSHEEDSANYLVNSIKPTHQNSYLNLGTDLSCPLQFRERLETLLGLSSFYGLHWLRQVRSHCDRSSFIALPISAEADSKADPTLVIITAS
jgi:hypothetical protein